MATYPSEFTLSEVLCKADSFSPIKVFYNGEIIWDDDADIENWIPYHKAIVIYKKNHKYFKYYKVTNINISITDYHHCILYIDGYVDVEAINENEDWGVCSND